MNVTDAELHAALIEVLGAGGYVNRASGYSQPTPRLVYSDLSTSAKEHVRAVLGGREPKAPGHAEPPKPKFALPFAPEYLEACRKSAERGLGGA